MVDLYVGPCNEFQSTRVSCRFLWFGVPTCSYLTSGRPRWCKSLHIETVVDFLQQVLPAQIGFWLVAWNRTPQWTKVPPRLEFSHKSWRCVLLVLQLGKHTDYWKSSGYKQRTAIKSRALCCWHWGLTAADCAKQLSFARPKPSGQFADPHGLRKSIVNSELIRLVKHVEIIHQKPLCMLFFWEEEGCLLMLIASYCIQFWGCDGMDPWI